MTSSMSMARPLTGALLCHFTPCRSFSVICVPPWPISHDSAMSGMIWLSGHLLTP
jgi:hypothetical protein